MATQPSPSPSPLPSPSPEEQLLKIIKEGVPVKKPLPEEQLLKVIKESSQAANSATGTIAPPASSAINLKIKPPQPPPSVLPGKTDAKPSLGGAGTVAAAVPIVPLKAEPPVSSSPSSPRGYFQDAAQALAARYASGAQFLAIFWRIEIINWSLALVFVLLLGGFIYFVALGRPNIEKTIRHFPRPPARSLKVANHEAFMPPGEYVKISNKRDIFSREQRAAAGGAAVAEKPTDSQNKAGLQLVGIYFSETPEVIIEDKPDKKTYFLKVGDNIKGIKVKSIHQDRVILESGGVDWELK